MSLLCRLSQNVETRDLEFCLEVLRLWISSGGAEKVDEVSKYRYGAVESLNAEIVNYVPKYRDLGLRWVFLKFQLTESIVLCRYFCLSANGATSKSPSLWKFNLDCLINCADPDVIFFTASTLHIQVITAWLYIPVWLMPRSWEYIWAVFGIRLLNLSSCTVSIESSFNHSMG